MRSRDGQRKGKEEEEDGKGGRWERDAGVCFAAKSISLKRSTKLNRDPDNSVEAWNEIIFSFAAKGRALVTIFTERDSTSRIDIPLYPPSSPFSGCIVTGCRSKLIFHNPFEEILLVFSFRIVALLSLLTILTTMICTMIHISFHGAVIFAQIC